MAVRAAVAATVIGASVGPAFVGNTAQAAVFAPVSIDAGVDESVLEGGTFARSVAIVDGEDNGAAGWTYTIDYGDGSAAVAGATVVPTLSLSHVYANGPAARTVTVVVVDDVAETASDTILISVLNVAPIPVVVGNATTSEGAIYSLTLSAIDPAGAFDPPLFSVDWGDGSVSTLSLRPPGTYSHIFADDDDGPINSSTRNVRVSVFDDVAMSVAFFPVIVNNVAPTISLSGATTNPIGVPYALTLGAITDPGKDTVTSRVIHWGDGAVEVAATSGVFTHSYAIGGSFAVTVDLVDEDGTFVSASSLPLSVVTPAPTAPAGLSAVALSRSSIRLTWSNTAVAQTTVEVERCKGAGCTRFARVATLTGTTATFTDSGLSSRTSYTYRVRVKNAAGTSPYSNTAAAVTPR
ncbi:MAG: fibronectin type III domain-containing protein [Ilumatobacteraceae bacterium]